MNAQNVSRSIAIPSVGTMSCNKGTHGIVRYVAPVEIGANGIVRAVTDVRMACRCPVNDVAGGYEHRSKGRKQENRCVVSLRIICLPAIPPPRCLRQFPFVFVLR